MLLLDNIVFELQKAGGVSLVWRAILDACIADTELNCHAIDSGAGFKNIFYPENMNGVKLIKERGPLALRRYLTINKNISATVFHSSYFRVHSNKKVKNIVTVHDFVYEKFDSGLRKHVHLLQKKHALKAADVIICVSQNTKEDLLSYHPALGEKEIRVIYNGVSTDFCPHKEGADALSNRNNAPYLLYVGGRFAHKNFNAALQLLLTPAANKMGLKLKVVGGGALTDKEQELISHLGLLNKVSHTGHVSSKELNMLYNLAFAFIYPSLYEGFGIPPLEAMAAGCPVICSNISSIPEVVGQAGLLFDPTQIESVEPYLEKLQHRDYRQQIVRNGLEHSAQFSWHKTGQQTLSLYKELL